MTCAKRRVTAYLVTESGDLVIGDNSCANPQEVCPREPGEGYEKCRTVCGQHGHAETQALEAAKRHGIDPRNATVYVTGHYHVCQQCAEELRDSGVREIVIEVAP